ncbi:MAG: TRAP transporter small permease [Gammaproteobacteria bacterium]|nr:TRAP transporter small permease [Gammaproteobacteria bacterium]
MRNFLTKAERLTDAVSLFCANVAAMILLLLVALTCVDVVGRYFFNSPLVGTVELVEICMGAITFFSFPLMFIRNDHIIVDLIPHFKRGYIGWITSIVFLAVTFYVAVKLGDRVFDYAVRAFEDGDVTEYIGIPRYPVVGFVSAAIFSAAAISLLRLGLLLSKPGENLHVEGDSKQ